MDRYGDGEEPCQTAVFAEGHENAAYRHHRRHDEHGEPHAQQLLDLLDVVGGAGDQRGRPEAVDLALRIGLDLLEDRVAQVAAEGVGRLGLAPVHRLDPGAVDFGKIGGVIEYKTDDYRQEAVTLRHPQPENIIRSKVDHHQLEH